MPRVIVLDRDGVINKDLGRHVLHWDEFEFLPGVLSALAMMHAKGYGVSIASNQSAVDAGTLSRETLDDITRRMVKAIHVAGGEITSVHYCPHTPFARCGCRKPGPNMLTAIARRHNVETMDILMVGDSWRDVEAARACHARPVLVLTGKTKSTQRRYPHITVYSDLKELAGCLISQKPACV